MLVITHPCGIKDVSYRRLEFDRIDDPNSCLSFECDENGEPILENESQTTNYHYAVSHPEIYKAGRVRTFTRSIKTPARGLCKCGKELVLTNRLHGACQCDHCGQWYNLFGQELLPPDRWGEE